MRILLTGAAGFIGSHLAYELSRRGDQVVGIDSFTDYYDRGLKERNLGLAGAGGGWEFAELDVAAVTPEELSGVEVVIHLAGQPGVRDSWNKFERYTSLNLDATNRLARSCVEAGVRRMVFASSSSVYGDLVAYPTSETDHPTPRSPYGVTKLAGESLLEAYTLAHEFEVLAMRFFTVYGPGQRPDMATQRLIRAALSGDEFTLFGDGEQRRDFTFVSDVVDACVSATECEVPRPMLRLNIGGSGDTSMNRLIELVETATQREVKLVRVPAQLGDVRRTGANPELARQILDWHPRVRIEEGVPRQTAFERTLEQSAWV